MARQASDYMTIEGCRSCGRTDLDLVLEFGQMPLSDGLVPTGYDRADEPTYPLTLVRCPQCTLVQILETVAPRTLFGDDYPYYSSFSDYLVNHARINVDGIIQRTGVDEHSLVVELASNDGYLLQWFAKRGVPVLGIDPAPGPAAAAVEKGIPTLVEFFDLPMAQRLSAEGKQADVIVGNNVLAHVPDQNEFVKAMGHLLAPGGTVVMEFPYLRDLIDHTEFDTIYHEHACYFSVTAVRQLFERHGLDLVRVEHHPIHGGSLRVYFESGGQPETSVASYLESEEAIGMLEPAYYESFATRVQEVKTSLISLLDQIRVDGGRVAAYAAAAKGAIMLNYCGIGADRIEYVVDRNVHKHGLEMPGVALPIRPVEDLLTDRPDFALILAWNFKEEIMKQQSAFTDAGGRFLVPLPVPALL